MFNSLCLIGGYITKHPFRGWFLSLACIRPCLDEDLKVCCLKVLAEWSSWQIRKPPLTPSCSCMWKGWSVGPFPSNFGSINLAAEGDSSTLQSEHDFRQVRGERLISLPSPSLELSKGLRLCILRVFFRLHPPACHIHDTHEYLT